MNLVRPFQLLGLLAGLLLFAAPLSLCAEEPPAPVPAAPATSPPATEKFAEDKRDEAIKTSDIAWVLVSSALVMVMMPGLALFYGGMVRRKNVLGTMMHTMAALGIVGVQWVLCGYMLSFGETKDGLVGWSPELIGLSSSAAVGTTDKPEDQLKKDGIDPAKATKEEVEAAEKTIAQKNRFKTFPNTKLPLYLHAMFQGMFAIITVALISGAFAERVKFGSYCLFILLWTTVVYDPLAHWVWAYNWTLGPEEKALSASGWLGAKGAIDFAGGTVVHIAAGVSGLAAILFLRKRHGYLKQTFHPNSMVFTLLGAGLLWFGWFGFNGGSALASNAQAVSAFTVTQVAAAAASLGWMAVEWIHRGKPTALGFASGLVAGLVAITPASGFVTPGGALIIGTLSGIICYWAVTLKSVFGYDDSLDAFGIHGVGGILGAVLTGALVSLPLWVYGFGASDATAFPGKLNAEKTAIDYTAQIQVQLLAVAAAAVYGFVVTTVLVLLIDYTIGFTVKPAAEAEGLDLSQHNETGMDVGPDVDAGAVVTIPKAASTPPGMTNGQAKRFTVVVEGVAAKDLQKAWEELCKPKEGGPSKEFAAVYPYLTTVKGNLFRFRGGDAIRIKESIRILFQDALDTTVNTHVEH